MERKCVICRTDLNPLSGALEASLTKIEKLQKWNMDVPSPICANCFSNILARAEARFGEEFNYEYDPPPEFTKETLDAIRNLNVYTYNPYTISEAKYLDLVSSHIIIGTSLLTELSSKLTDLLGQTSSAYNEVLIVAERDCLYQLKENAFKKGANAVVSLKVNYTELTDASGMIMVNMMGTAVLVTGQNK
ncbi:MAG: heavy metal-binding domain-containing protein [Deltaproteobacteria bacterium]|jgi:uncharacterized protein YbjQ (UPF0145 family)|nr:heavy metal-binding domain-containing protein [Deltaproteobacteria bacterium]